MYVTDNDTISFSVHGGIQQIFNFVLWIGEMYYL
jgi:hypothetical protein